MVKYISYQNPRHQVFLLHGIGWSSMQMKGIASFLAKKNFEVFNLSYPSTRYSISDLATIIHEKICEKILVNENSDFNDVFKNRKTHFVGFSMGGLVLRALFHKFSYQNLGRVVHIGTPNQGSEVADFFKNFRIYKKFFGPAGQQLITNQDSFLDIFGEVNYELGVIAGNLSLEPFSSYLIKKPNDGKVSVDSTKIKGMKEHLVLPIPHTFLPHVPKVKRSVYNFLQNGSFYEIKKENHDSVEKTIF